MNRTNRHTLRLFFLLVLLMVLIGAWWGSSLTLINPDSFQASGATSNNDWIDLIASLGDTLIQLFLGLTSGGT
jgi:hypothetical protein